jgi:ATP-binding cassette, subfamily C (CFTR/MRP), member 4
LSHKELSNKAGEKIINLLTSDIGKFDTIFLFYPYLLIAPVEVTITVYMLATLTDLSILSGLGVIAVIIPIQLLIGKFSQRIR